jgi:hypothetical protein
MIIERRPAYPGKIIVSFENQECVAVNDEGDPIWYDAATEIRNKLSYPTAVYIHDLKAWSVVDNPENMAILQEIKEKYFMDKDQIALNLGSEL